MTPLPPQLTAPPGERRSARSRLTDDKVRLWTTLGVPVVLGAAFAATVGPDSLLEAASRPAAIAKMLAGLVGWLVLAWFVLPRLVRPALPRTAVVIVLALAAAAVTILPYYSGSTVREALPTTPAVAGQGNTGPDSAVDVVARGAVQGIGHGGRGSALLIELPDGSFVLRFEGLSVDNAPDPHVYLVPGADRESPGGVRLDTLKASKGDQNYPVAASDVPEGPLTALIWCRAFSVPIAAATLR